MRTDELAGVVCVGETMAMVTPAAVEPLRTAESFRVEVGGAESNVALYLRDLGHRASWFSRLGADPLGERVLDYLRTRGVDVSSVVLDDTRPTGVYFKDPNPHGTSVHYYRAGSAASGMGAADAARLPLDDVDLVHTTGITCALSQSCTELMTALFDRCHDRGLRVSFDVNYRPKLWPATFAAQAIQAIARRTDVALVGLDEAVTLWGVTSADEVPELFAPCPLVVVKDAAVGATAYRDGTSTYVPATEVDVVEPVGAGDAFAAGFLSALLSDADLASCLANGHRVAAHALSSTADYVPLPEGTTT
ncbi:MAG: sugar kinase [Streptosporangiales bacterium]|nr:sugar kinase [Streptosporangiales bacterium]